MLNFFGDDSIVRGGVGEGAFSSAQCGFALYQKAGAVPELEFSEMKEGLYHIRCQVEQAKF